MLEVFIVKSLVVYYSRTGTTRIAADTAAEILSADIEKIAEPNARVGVWGFVKSVYDAIKKTCPDIAPAKKKPEAYDLVVFCTPIWAGKMSCPARAYLSRYGKDCKRTAYIITRGSRGAKFEQAFDEMDSLTGKGHLDAISVSAHDDRAVSDAAEAFAKGLKKRLSDMSSIGEA